MVFSNCKSFLYGKLYVERLLDKVGEWSSEYEETLLVARGEDGPKPQTLNP